VESTEDQCLEDGLVLPMIEGESVVLSWGVLLMFVCMLITAFVFREHISL
jgi:hypothetical protein